MPSYDCVEIVSSLRRDGYAIVPQAFPIDAADAINHSIDHLLLQMSREVSPPPAFHCWLLPDQTPFLFKIKPVLDLLPGLADFAVNAGLLKILTTYFGKRPRLFEDKLMMKEPVSSFSLSGVPVLDGIVHPHRDSSYFVRRGLPQDSLSSGFLLNDSNINSGSLQVWPKSHNWKIRDREDPTHGPVFDDDMLRCRKPRVLIAKAGSLLIWHSHTIHASADNRSGRPRRMLVLGHCRDG